MYRTKDNFGVHKVRVWFEKKIADVHTWGNQQTVILFENWYVFLALFQVARDTTLDPVKLGIIVAGLKVDIKNRQTLDRRFFHFYLEIDHVLQFRKLVSKKLVFEAFKVNQQVNSNSLGSSCIHKSFDPFQVLLSFLVAVIITLLNKISGILVKYFV